MFSVYRNKTKNELNNTCSPHFVLPNRQNKLFCLELKPNLKDLLRNLSSRQMFDQLSNIYQLLFIISVLLEFNSVNYFLVSLNMII